MARYNEFEFLKRELQDRISSGAIKHNEKGIYKVGYTFSDCKDRIFARGNDADSLAQNLLKNKNNRVAAKQKEEILDRRFDKIAIDWYETEIKGRGLGKNNIKNYKSLLNKHIISQFGFRDASEIMHSELQQYLNSLGKQYGQDHVRKVKNCLHNIFLYAQSNELIDRIPSFNLKMPNCQKFEQNKKDPVTIVDGLPLALKISSTDIQMKTILMIFFVYGIRTVELVSLKWNNINFMEKYIHITHSKYTDAITTKDKNSVTRYLPLCDTVANALKELKESNMPLNNDDEYIFRTRKSNKPITTKALDNYFVTLMRNMDIYNGATLYNNKIIESTNIRAFTPYAFRKRVTTKLDSMNFNDAITQQFIGHKPKSVKDKHYSCMTFEKDLRPQYKRYMKRAEEDLLSAIKTSEYL